MQLGRDGVFRRLPIAVLLSLCAMVMTVWAFVVPIFESPDEPDHWMNARYIHSHWELPPYNSTYIEANQAPLYYLLISPLASPSATPARTAPPRKTFDLACPPHLFENCAADIHKYWPIRRARLATAALSLIGILFTALAAFEITTSLSCALIAGALIGLLPQFDFRAASVNNDPGVVVFSAIATYFISRIAMRGFELLPAVLGSIAIALAFLAKVNAMALVPAFAASLLLAPGRWKSRVSRLGLLAVSGVIVFPWLLRNKALYGNVLASGMMPQIVPELVHRQSLLSPYFLLVFPEVTFRSSIGYFGWMNVPLPGPIYLGYTLVFLIACAGLWSVFKWQHKFRKVILVLASIPIMSLAIVIGINLTFPQPQGRLLFPGLSAAATLGAIGLSTITGNRKYVAAVLLAGGLSVNVYALSEVVYPAYWRENPSQTALAGSLCAKCLDSGGP